MVLFGERGTNRSRNNDRDINNSNNNINETNSRNTPSRKRIFDSNVNQNTLTLCIGV